jgi:hypothetical protein
MSLKPQPATFQEKGQTHHIPGKSNGGLGLQEKGQTHHIPGKSNGLNQASPLKPRTREAAAILDSFPLLNFMQSQVLLMPENRNGQ